MKHYRIKVNKALSAKLQRLLPIIILLLAGMNAWAQTKQVSGVVTDGTGETVIGASVLEKGTTNGTITDLDGKFILTVNENAVLQISYVGYTTQEVPVKGKTSFNITLKEDSEMLEEVVVVGYGAQKRRASWAPSRKFRTRNCCNRPQPTYRKPSLVKSQV